MKIDYQKSLGRLLGWVAILPLMWSSLQGQSPQGNNAYFSYPGAPLCQNEPNVTPLQNGVGTYSEATGNIVFVNNVTGELNLALCQPGTWTIKHVVFPDSVSGPLTILAADDATYSYPQYTACQGVDSVLNATILGTSGGTFSSAPPGLAINAVTGDVDVNASAPGSYIVSYTTAGVCPATMQDTINIGVWGDPSFNYLASGYCAVGTILPTVTTPGGIFFNGSASLALNPNTGEIDLSLTASGTYVITYNLGGVCPSSETDTIEVVTPYPGEMFQYADSVFCTNDPNPVPVLLGPNNVIFSADPGLVFANVNTAEISITGSVPGTYSVYATAVTVCAEMSSQTIQILGPAQLTLVVSGDTLFAPTAGTNFQWYLNGQLISGATQSSFIASTGGSYEVHYDDTSCGVVALGTYVATNDASSWLAQSQVFPNPSSGRITFTVDMKQPGKLTWEVLSPIGNVLLRGAHTQTTRQHRAALDLSALPSGTYLLRLTSDNGTVTEKVVLMH